MAEGASGDRAAGGRRPPLRLVSAAIFLVLAGVVAAASVITLNVSRDQEQRQLRERTGEAATVLASAFSGVEASLQLLGEIVSSNRGRSALFISAARSVTTSPTQTWLVTAAGETGLRVITAAGNGAAAQATPALEPLARRALSTKGMVSGMVRYGKRVRLMFGMGQAAGPGTVVWTGVPLTPDTPTKSSASSPWGDLNIALYLSPRPSRATLAVATTRNLPLRGAAFPFKVGTDTWLLVASSPTALVGTLAQDMPWIILAIGGLAAVLVTAVVETLARRRDYADALAHQRTASLRKAITELQTAQAQLVRQEKLAAVGQLASSVGHELRNPLGVVMNVLYLMEAQTGQDDEPMHRHMATAKREISAATLIVSDLLDYSAGRAPILAPVQVADLVAEALSVVPPPAGIETVVRASDPELSIEADRDQLRQALLNLITNGYDAMPDGGVLTITATSVPGSARITVADTGTGMSEQTRDSIFTPFFTSKARGIGLGLAVTKRVVEAHGGTIAVESAPSAGTSFTITLPTAVLAGASR